MNVLETSRVILSSEEFLFYRRPFFHVYKKKCRSFVKKESEIFSVQMNKRWSIIGNKLFIKGQLNSEWIYEVIVSPKMPTKNFSDFCPGGLLEGRAEI